MLSQTNETVYTYGRHMCSITINKVIHSMLLRLFCLCICCSIFSTLAHETKPHAHSQHGIPAMSFAADKQGKLWRVSLQHDKLVVDSSTNQGAQFSNPVTIDTGNQKVVAKGEDRPHLIVGPNKTLYLAWTEDRKGFYAGHIWFTRSLDAGLSFETPKIVHQDKAEIAHRFHAMELASDGKLYLIWTDARDATHAKTRNQPFTGLSLYYSVSLDQGNTFQPEQKLIESSCECCRLAVTQTPNGRIAALWRHVFEGNEREQMIGEIQTTGRIVTKRASYHHWKIDGCPHHGGSIISGGEADQWWGYHFAYFDGNSAKPGLYYSRVDGNTWSFFPAKRFAELSKHPARPTLFAKKQQVWLAWLESEGKQTKLFYQVSDDEGRSWSTPSLLHETHQSNDYPVLLSLGEQPFVLWPIQNESLFMKALTPSSSSPN